MDRFLTVKDQFRSLPTDEEYLQQITISEENGTALEPIPGYQNITKGALQNALQPNGVFTADMLDAYIDLVCKYHNTRDPAPADHLPKYINFHALFWDRIVKRNNTQRPNRGLSWGTEQLRLLAPNSAKAERRLQLLQVEYILIPIEREFKRPGQNPNFQGRGHVGMMVVSMQNKTIEYFDGIRLEPYQYLYHIFEYLIYELREHFELEDWSYRMNNNPIQEPTCDRNGNVLGSLEKQYHEYGIDCGIHAAIHAFNTTFGLYDPIHQPQFDPVSDVLKKRKRIVLDLLKHEISFGPPDDKTLQSRINNHFLAYCFSAPDPSNPSPFLYTQHKYENWSYKKRRPLRKTANDFYRMTRLLYSTWALYGRNPFPRPELDILVGFNSARVLDAAERGKKMEAAAKEFLVKQIEGLDMEINRHELRREEWNVPVLMKAIYAFYDERRGGHMGSWETTPG